MSYFGRDSPELGLAEALYNNESEWPEELAFRRGDMLRVLEDRPGGGLADGWWLCVDASGRTGIVPANRLRLISKVVTPRRVGDLFSYGINHPSPLDLRLIHDVGHPFEQQHGHSLGGPPTGSTLDRLGGGGGSGESGAIGSGGSLRGGGGSVVRSVPIKLETPPPPPQRKYFHQFGQGEGQQQQQPPMSNNNPSSSPLTTTNSSSSPSSISSPPSTSIQSDSSGANTINNYQSARFQQLMTQNSPNTAIKNDSSGRLDGGVGGKTGGNSSSVLQNVMLDTLYDNPKNPLLVNQQQQQQQEYPSSAAGNPPFLSRRSGGESLYDVPTKELPSDLERMSLSSDSEYQALLMDAASQSGDAYVGMSEQEALDTLHTRFSSLQSALSSLSAKTSASPNPNWRSHSILSDNLIDIKNNVKNVVKALNYYVDFCTGSLVSLNQKESVRVVGVGGGPSSGVGNSVPCRKLAHLLRPLRDSQGILEKAAGGITWTIASLARDKQTHSHTGRTDALDQFMAVARSIPDDSAHVRAFLQANVKLIWEKPVIGQTLSASATSTSGRESASTTRFSDRYSTGAGNSSHSTGGGTPKNSSSISTGDQTAGGRRPFPPVHDALEYQQQNSKNIHDASLNRPPRGTNNHQYQQQQRVIEEQELDSSNSSDHESFFDDYDFVDPQPVLNHHQDANNGGAVTPTASALNGSGGDMTLKREDSMTPTGNGPSGKYSTLTTAGNGGGSGVYQRNGPNESHQHQGCDVTDGGGKAGSNGQNGGTKGKTGNSATNSSDGQIVSFYVSQVEQHMETLSGAIEEFLSAIEDNEAPSVYVGKSKLVILAAHKLVYMGDSLAQCLTDRRQMEQCKESSDNLSGRLKECVDTTKQAAYNHPSVPAIQSMVDAMVNVSHAAHDLKLLILHFRTLSVSTRTTNHFPATNNLTPLPNSTSSNSSTNSTTSSNP